MQMLIVNGVDLTPFLAHKGYQNYIEDVDASAERSMNASLTRDRVARVPVIEAKILGMLRQEDVTTITTACMPAKIQVTFRNTETGSMTTSFFYAKYKQPRVYSTANGYVQYESFTIKFTGFGGI